MTITPSPRMKKRYLFVLRIWEHGHKEPVWIGEVLDVATGEKFHMNTLEALFDWLRQKTIQTSHTQHH